MDLSKLSAKALHAEIHKRDMARCKALDATIRAGMGNMRHADIVELSKGSSLLSRVMLARDYLTTCAAWVEADDELMARKRWHGTDKPICKRA